MHALILNLDMKLVLNQTRSLRLMLSSPYFTLRFASDIKSFLSFVFDLSDREIKHLSKEESSRPTRSLSQGMTHSAFLILDVNDKDASRLSSKDSME